MTNETAKATTSAIFPTWPSFRSHYPAWSLTRRVDDIIEEMVRVEPAVAMP